jgi:hypothetical protein
VRVLAPASFFVGLYLHRFLQSFETSFFLWSVCRGIAAVWFSALEFGLAKSWITTSFFWDLQVSLLKHLTGLRFYAF